MSSTDGVTGTGPSTAYLDIIDRESTRRADRAQEAPTRDGADAQGWRAQARQSLAACVTETADDLNRILHELHQIPETAFGETRSASLIATTLEKYGIETAVGVHGLDTAIRAEIVGRSDGRGQRTIGILGEYDALPEIGHACGHNVIAAMAVGATLALKKLLDHEPDAFSGRVVFLGTPAEEGYTGKEYMARARAFDNLDAALMVHPFSEDVAEHLWLGRRVLTVTFTGIAAHASAQPFMGRNALDAATLAYQGIGLLRQQLPPVDRIHAVLTEGGTRASIIPQTARLELTVRSKYPETLRDLSERLEQVLRGAALMTGVSVEIVWDTHPPSLPVRSNSALTQRWAATQQDRGRHPLPSGVLSETIAASTDFGNVSHRVPGIHPMLKIADRRTALHTREFALAAASEAAERGAFDGAYGLAVTALEFLTDDDLAEAVKTEFADAGGAMNPTHYFAHGPDSQETQR